MVPGNIHAERRGMTPFLLRLFYRNGASHGTHEFLPSSMLPEHLTIYTWPNATLRELASHLSSDPTILPSESMGTRLVFRLIYPDAKAIANANAPANFITRDIGSVVLGHDRPGVADYDSIMSGEEPENRDQSYDYADLDHGGRDDHFFNEDVEARLGGGRSKYGSASGASAVSDDGNLTLNEAKFVIGDYISVTILAPDSDGSIISLPMPRPQSRRNIDAVFEGDVPAPPGRRRRGGRARGPKNFSAINSIPVGDWRRGERLPDPPRGGGGGGGGRRANRW